MRKNTKRVDIIIVIVLILIAAAIVLAVLPPKNDQQTHDTVSADTDGNGTITYKDYIGKRVGIITGSSFEQPTLEYLPDSEYLYYDTLSDIILALNQGKIDCFICDEPVLRMAHIEHPDIGYLSEVLRTDNYSFAFRKNDERADRIMEQFNEMLSDFAADGTLEKMKDKWFAKGSEANKVDLSGFDGTNGKLNIVTVSTNVPFSMIADGELTGYSIELVSEFCRRYGYDCSFDQTSVSSSLAGISTGIYDMLASCATVTEERKESMNFSDPIYIGGITLAVRSSDITPDNSTGAVEDRPFSYYAENKKIGAITGGLYEIMIRERYPDAEILQYNNQPDMAVALGAGVIDAFTCPESSAKDFMKADPSLTYLKEVFMEIPYGFAFERSADKEYLRDQMNEFLRKLHGDGTYDELVSKWFGDDESVKTVDLTGLTGENGSIRYITAPTMQPFSYISNGTNAGFEVELVARFCREYGYSLNIDNGEFASLIPGITSGMYDIASGTIMITAERAESVNFSDVYYTANAVAVVRKENTDTETAPGFFDSIAESFEKNFIREERWKLILDGIGTTCLITVLSTVFGSLLAFLICMFRRTGSRLANAVSNIYVKLLQGTPMVVLLMILYYVILGKSGLEAVWVAIIGFTLNFGAYASEIMRSGIESIDGGQREAALALGYSENQAFFRFIFPQAAVRFLPVYRGEIVSLLKSTSIVGYIAIQDLTKMSDIIRSRTYEAFFPLIATAIIYFILAWIISLILKFILKKVSPGRKRG
ncbi:MAG: ABC transporter permease subunit [Ruminiclostridium sp.]|nr:ABC transporter permease subunit [Ruminiclostridium sp.]